jgi:gamma-glutamyltranspeptidase/glutathione hydrolase
MLQRVIAPFAALLLGACASVPAPQAAVPQAELHSAGVVSAADPRAAEAGAAMLRQGGSATDAAIATMLALTVVEPQSSGIGGGGFYVRATPAGEVETIDGREKAPSGADGNWLLGPDGQPLGFREVVNTGLSVGVPGNIALAAEAHEQHGRLPWANLFAPAIALARDGWELTPRFVRAITVSRTSAAHDPDGLALFYNVAGEPLPVGTRVRNEALARTLERIAQQGRETFYTGPEATALANEVAAETPRPGAMTPADVAAYEAKPREPVCGLYRAYRICGMAPPSSGATTVYAMLKQLEGVDLGALGPNSPTFWHLFAESQRLAYADRELYLGDADFVPVPVAGLIDPDYLASRGALISPTSTMATVEAGVVDGAPLVADGHEPEEGGTSHFVAVDRQGNVVSYTSTIESAFGSGIVSGGFYLNNELTDFSFVPEVDGRPVANRVEGNKRPRSSMAPTVVYDPEGRLMMAVGAAGGSTIPVQVARVLIGVIDFGLPVDEALALPVLYSPGDTVSVEQGTALEAMIPQLEALGHREVVARPPGFKANAAVLGPQGWVGGADPRSEGTAVSE